MNTGAPGCLIDHSTVVAVQIEITNNISILHFPKLQQHVGRHLSHCYYEQDYEYWLTFFKKEKKSIDLVLNER